MIPDKIYIVPDFIEGLSLERKDYDDEVCYIRKDALLELIKDEAKFWDDGEMIFGQLLEKINEL